MTITIEQLELEPKVAHVKQQIAYAAQTVREAIKGLEFSLSDLQELLPHETICSASFVANAFKKELDCCNRDSHRQNHAPECKTGGCPPGMTRGQR
jgi:hypothetical protein